MSEADLQKTIIEYLNYSGHYVWRNNTGMAVFETKGKKRYFRAGKIGSADILGVAKDGRIIAVECKSKGGKITDHQEDFLLQVASRGGYSLVAYNLEDVERYFALELPSLASKSSL